AQYSGNSNYLSSNSSVISFTVSPVASTTTLSVSPNTSTSGASVTLSAVVSNQATGTVNFESNGSTIASCGAVVLSAGTASCTTVALAVGTDSLTAVYSGNANRSGSTSNAIPFVVSTAPLTSTSTVLKIERTSLVAGYPVQLIATVSPAEAGTFGFFSNGAYTSGCSAISATSGSGTCSTTGLTAGTDLIDVVFTPSSSQVTGSTSATASLPVWTPVHSSGTGALPAAAITTQAGIVSLLDQYFQGQGRYTQAQITYLNQAAIPDAISYEFSLFDVNGSPSGQLAFISSDNPNYLPELIVDALAPYVTLSTSKFNSCFKTDTNSCFINQILPNIEVTIQADMQNWSCFLNASCYVPSGISSSQDFYVDWSAAMGLYYLAPWQDIETLIQQIDPDYPQDAAELSAWTKALMADDTWGLPDVDIGDG
ncbi:MAG: Ig-like domain-containing protein, partial [Acidimicrobiales bacterium]